MRVTIRRNPPTHVIIEITTVSVDVEAVLAVVIAVVEDSVAIAVVEIGVTVADNPSSSLIASGWLSKVPTNSCIFPPPTVIHP